MHMKIILSLIIFRESHHEKKVLKLSDKTSTLKVSLKTL